MSASEDLFLEPENFSGTARVFPLPNLVLFPHVLQPLHIFEPRYRELLEEALSGDRLIAMGLLAPGWESDYEGRPPVCPVACLGRVASHQKLEGGRYNILLAGLKRVRLVKELPPTKMFREFQVGLHEDFYPVETAAGRAGLQRKLLDAFRHLLPDVPETREQLEQLLKAGISLGTLSDIVAYTLDMAVENKERLLREQNVDRRVALVLEHMQKAGVNPGEAAGSFKNFPPGFSNN